MVVFCNRAEKIIKEFNPEVEAFFRKPATTAITLLFLAATFISGMLRLVGNLDGASNLVIGASYACQGVMRSTLGESQAVGFDLEAQEASYQSFSKIQTGSLILAGFSTVFMLAGIKHRQVLEKRGINADKIQEEYMNSLHSE